MKMPEFRLNEFRDLAKWVGKKFPAPVAYFLIGWLWGLEDIWIDAKTKAAVEQAIAPHTPPEPTIDGPTYYTEPSEVEGLDIIGYSYGIQEESERGLHLPDSDVGQHYKDERGKDPQDDT